MERVGLEYIKGKILEDAEGRKAYYKPPARFARGAKDPWETSREEKPIKQFIPIRLESLIQRKEESIMSNWKLVCPLEDIPPLGSRVVQQAMGGDIAIFRTSEDEVFALHDKCPHKGGPLSQGIVLASASPVRCTAGTSSENGGRWRPMSAIAAGSRSRSRAATSICRSDRQAVNY